MKKDRREFLKMMASGIAGSSIVPGVLSSGLAFGQSSSNNVSGIARALFIDPITTQYLVLSPCCQNCTDIFVVSHYQPIYLCEVSRGGDDSVITGANGNIRRGILAHKRGYKSFTVRLWSIPDWAIDIATGYQSCRLCGSDFAPTSDQESSGSGGFFGTDSSACFSSQWMQAALGQINDSLGDCFPELLYDSSLDYDWRFSCYRDVLRVNPIRSQACAAQGDNNIITGVSESLFGDTEEYCVGNWGPIYPRQMAWQYADSRMGAALSAYRALHLAGEKDMLDFSVDVSLGKLQMTHPHQRPGYLVGTDDGRRSITSQRVSETDQFIFVWWLPVGCCKTRQEIQGNCTPNTSCSSSGS